MAYRPTEYTEARKAAARERIVSAAHDLIASGGYRAAPVAAVAEKAGVATGTVYRHFPSKSELFAEVFRRASQHEVDVVSAAAAGPGPAVDADRRRRGDLRPPRPARPAPGLGAARRARRPGGRGRAPRLPPRLPRRVRLGRRRRRRIRRAARAGPRADRRRAWSARSARRSSARCPPPPARATKSARSPASCASASDRSPARSPPMSAQLERTQSATHEVANQSIPLEGFNAFTEDRALAEALEREGAGWARERAVEVGRARRKRTGHPLGLRGQRERAGAADPRPLRPPHRRGRVPPRVARAHAPRRRPRPALAAVARAPRGRARRARGHVHDADPGRGRLRLPDLDDLLGRAGPARPARAGGRVGAALHLAGVRPASCAPRPRRPARCAAWR